MSTWKGWVSTIFNMTCSCFCSSPLNFLEYTIHCPACNIPRKWNLAGTCRMLRLIGWTLGDATASSCRCCNCLLALDSLDATSSPYHWRSFTIIHHHMNHWSMMLNDGQWSSGTLPISLFLPIWLTWGWYILRISQPRIPNWFGGEWSPARRIPEAGKDNSRRNSGQLWDAT